MMNAQQSQYEKMIETPIPRLVTTLAVPTIISMLITSVYNMADTYFVSKLGSSASGAIGIVFSVMAIIQAVGFTIGMGAGSTISRLLGEKRQEEAEEIAVSGVLAALVFGAVLMLLGLCCLEPFMKLLGATDTILPYAKDYAHYILLAAPVMCGSFVLNNLLRSEGKAKFAMVGIAAGGVLNLVLDPLFIFTWRFGIAGAAIATALSQTIGFVVLLACFLFHKSNLRLLPARISRHLSTYGIILKNGFPSFCRQGLASIATVILNRSAAEYGDEAVAAMSIVGKIFMVFFCISIGFGQGYQPVAGYNYGAGQWKRVKYAFRFTLMVGVILMGIMGSAGFVFAEELMALFMEEDSAVVAIGAFALRCQCAALVCVPVSIVSNMTFQAVGESGKATFLSACRQGIFFLPLIIILPKIWGLMGIQLTQAVSDVCTAVVCVPFIVGFFRQLREKEQEEGKRAIR